ncbi:MAG: hypothetical protein LBT09_06645 [Planctomycetaceae bacterium]|jgi:hypothetical protein|nr:hypothetical protein [Planctomycetaceae bacterium]
MQGKIVVYTTGAFLEPVKIGNQYHWVVTEFNDDTYRDGDHVSVVEYADKPEKLIKDEEDDN